MDNNLIRRSTLLGGFNGSAPDKDMSELWVNNHEKIHSTNARIIKECGKRFREAGVDDLEEIKIAIQQELDDSMTQYSAAEREIAENLSYNRFIITGFSRNDQTAEVTVELKFTEPTRDLPAGIETIGVLGSYGNVNLYIGVDGLAVADCPVRGVFSFPVLQELADGELGFFIAELTKVVSRRMYLVGFGAERARTLAANAYRRMKIEELKVIQNQ